MRDVDDVPSLICDIYDASLDPSRWAGVLRKSRDYLGGSAAAVFSKDLATRSLNVFYQCGGVEPHYTQLYFDTYERIDPTTAAQAMAGVGELVCSADIIDTDDLRSSRFYQEWVRPQGIADLGAVVLEKSATGAALFGIFRQDRHGVIDDEARWRLGRIVPHIRRAVLIGRAIELKTAEAATFADTLDGLAAGMFLVDAAGRIVHANASGRMLIAEGAALRAAGGKLVPTDPRAAQALGAIIAAAGAGDAALGRSGTALPLAASDGEQYAIHVLPLTSGARRQAGIGLAAVAAVFIRKAAIDVASPPEIIASHYGLTPTELRVLLSAVQVGGVPEIADALGVGQPTVKTHLHNLFNKTGASRQADLVKLVAGYSSPLMN
jgi:DNA-binding CsgD family transcriptional regulator